MTLCTSEAALEAEIKTKGLNAPRVTPAQIDATILAEQFFVPPGTTLTVCVLTLQNGFTVTGESAAASPENFDEAIGRRIARDNARNKIWALEGYLLRAKLSTETRHTAAAIEMAAIEMAARVAHEVNRAYCASIGDNSQPAWADAPQWQRESAISGVKFTLASPTATPERSHESWLAEKTADGWKYGPVKNPEAKEHPCFVPYAELPAAQRVKDYLFLAVVRSLAA